MLMEWETLTEHIEQGLSENIVQSSTEGVKKPKKKRSQIAKKGINRWNQDLLKRCLEGIEDIKSEQRRIRNKLDRLGGAEYSKEDVERFVVLDAVDKEILQRLLEVGVDGALPKDVAAEVNRRGGYSLKYYDVGRRLMRLNRKLQDEVGERLFEKLGKKWALTRFAFEVYGTSLADEPSAVDVVPELFDEEAR
jgi:hypothetical protein